MTGMKRGGKLFVILLSFTVNMNAVLLQDLNARVGNV